MNAFFVVASTTLDPAGLLGDALGMSWQPSSAAYQASAMLAAALVVFVGLAVLHEIMRVRRRRARRAALARAESAFPDQGQQRLHRHH